MLKDILASGGKHWNSPKDAEIDKRFLSPDMVVTKGMVKGVGPYRDQPGFAEPAIVEPAEALWIWPAEDKTHPPQKEVEITLHWRWPAGAKPPLEDSPPQGRLHYLVHTDKGFQSAIVLMPVVLPSGDQTQGTVEIKADFENATSVYEPVFWVEPEPGKRSNLIRLRLDARQAEDGGHHNSSKASTAALAPPNRATGDTPRRRIAVDPPTSPGWPPFSSTLAGKNEVRVSNPNDFAVTAGLRSSGSGKDFTIPARSKASAYVPDGRYDIYFRYSNDELRIYQGDSFTLTGNSVEIQIVQRPDGNYGITKVK